MKRRLKIYLIIFVVLLGIAVFLPAVMKTISNYLHTEQDYYSPHDLQRDDYIYNRKNQ